MENPMARQAAANPNSRSKMDYAGIPLSTRCGITLDHHQRE